MRQAAIAEACVGAGKTAGSTFRCRQPRASIACCRWRGDLPLPKPVGSALLASKSPGDPANAGLTSASKVTRMMDVKRPPGSRRVAHRGRAVGGGRRRRGSAGYPISVLVEPSPRAARDAGERDPARGARSDAAKKRLLKAQTVIVVPSNLVTVKASKSSPTQLLRWSRRTLMAAASPSSNPHS